MFIDQAGREMKADKNGTYPEMTVGNSDQLLSTVPIIDKTPYLFRTAGGSNDIGNRETDMIVGGTIAWNQLVVAARPNATVYGLTLERSADTLSLRIRGTATNSGNIGVLSTTIPGIVNHVYCMSIGTPSVENAVINSLNITGMVGTTALIGKLNSEGNIGININVTSGATIDITVKPQCFDLTQMFGTETVANSTSAGSTSTPRIANYIYDLEQASPGAGVAWFRKLFPEPYYPYNAGTLMSVKAVAHMTVGFNAYDHAAGAAKVLAGHEYQITGAYTLLALNGAAVTPDADGYFTPDETGLLTVAGGDGATTCVHLTWDGERDGQFEPYEAHTYPLDDDLELHGVPMLDGNNDLYYDGDVYESDGTVKRNYRVVDLGSLNWTFNATSQWGSAISAYRGDGFFGICSRIFIYDRARAYNNQGTEPYIAARGGNLWIRNPDWNGYTNAQVKAALSGIYLAYKFASGYETTETADPYDNPQTVDDFGTEEYADPRNGQFIQRYGVLPDLGALTWTTDTSYPTFKASIPASDNMKLAGDMICAGYTGVHISSITEFGSSSLDKIISATNSQDGILLRIKDSDFVAGGVADAAALKASLSGVPLIYELYEPESEAEEGVPIPVGHETAYTANLRAKLEMAPNSPDGDGDYVVRQTNGRNEYVPVTYPVADVQVNGTSVVTDGVANVPIASTTAPGVAQIDGNYGIVLTDGKKLCIYGASESAIKAGASNSLPIVAGRQHIAAFYGLAKAAGANMASSSNAVGTYTDAAKDAIMTMLGIIDMIAPHEGAQASHSYGVGGVFVHAGKLYKATAAIAANDAIAPGTNCTTTTLTELIGGN